MLPRALLDRLQVVQQCREADLEDVRGKPDIGVAANARPISRISRQAPGHIGDRARRASTVAELACAGRPAVFVPYPHDGQSPDL